MHTNLTLLVFLLENISFASYKRGANSQFTDKLFSKSGKAEPHSGCVASRNSTDAVKTGRGNSDFCVVFRIRQLCVNIRITESCQTTSTQHQKASWRGTGISQWRILSIFTLAGGAVYCSAFVCVSSVNFGWPPPHANPDIVKCRVTRRGDVTQQLLMLGDTNSCSLL